MKRVLEIISDVIEESNDLNEALISKLPKNPEVYDLETFFDQVDDMLRENKQARQALSTFDKKYGTSARDKYSSARNAIFDLVDEIHVMRKKYEKDMESK